MVMKEAKETALAMIQRHGMRALAVAKEHAAEMQIAGNTEAANRWGEISVAISELRMLRRVN